jgi:nitrite reductase (NAD(P)H)
MPSFGLIATDKGFNIFVAGNGGAKPRHCDLLAKDVPPTEVIPILDRYLMFYIRTADKLQRTARWLEALPGGVTYLRSVILDDSLGINASLEAQMQELVDSYFDEWAEAINTPAIAAKFRQFANTPETLQDMELETDRLQTRPVMWTKDSATFPFASLRSTWSETTWQPVLEAAYFRGADALPNGISATLKRGDTQLAVWRFKGRYYGTQQMCPHKRAFVLSDSLVGDDAAATPNSDSDPYIACPLHKCTFSLTPGACTTNPDLSIATFDVEERGDNLVYMLLPPVSELDAALGTRKWMVKRGEAGPGQYDAVDKAIGFTGVQRAKRAGVKHIVNGDLGMRRGVEVMKEVMEMEGGGGCGGGGGGLEW